MSEEASILVFGMDELASVIARKLHLAGHAVAMHQPKPPQTIRRRMAFADAWTDGTCTFEGVEARRADKAKDFLAGLRSGIFIPVLWHSFEYVTTQWPWDVLIDTRPQRDKPRQNLSDLTEFAIGLGRGFVAGDTCDVVIDIDGRDPGAVLRYGSIEREEAADDVRFSDGDMAVAPHHGLFHGTKLLGEPIEKGQIIGSVGATAIMSPSSGRVRGLARDGATVRKGADVAEVVSSPEAEFVGMTKRDRLIARSVAFVVEMHCGGHTPISLKSFF